MRTLRPFLLLTLLLTTPALGRAAPPTLTKYNFSADYVIVSRHTSDLAAHVDTTIMLFTYGPMSHPDNAPPTIIPNIGLYILVQNSITHDVLYFDTGEATPFELHMARGLPSATLRAAISTRSGVTTSVQLSWTGSGPIVNVQFGPLRDKLDDYVIMERADFKERPALVSGTIIGGPIAATFVDVPTARMGTTHQGSLYITVPHY